MKSYSHIMSYVINTPWAIMPNRLAIIMDVLRFHVEGGTLTDDEIRERIGADRERAAAPAQATGIAVLPLYGVIAQRMNMMTESSGGTSTERFAARFRQALNDSTVGGIVIDVDSPGGAVSGVEELSDTIYRARGTKPIVAVANSLAASAAYWIATAADEVVVAPGGEVGSVGVYAAHEDWSEALSDQGVKISLISAGKYKVEGNPYEPLTDEARAAIQERVDDYYAMFIKAIARGRGVGQSVVRGGFGEGRIVGAQRAVEMGMADRVETLDETIARMQRKTRRRGASAEMRRRRLALSTY